ncbi:hypothetical protein P43SY_011437 [Pythium insidiosum]|uniref:FAD-binding FR-type domain-containing protein n=1 Tax=Pythium insidiosum TaxID=114742 RepID=A0AAD5L823_PYTIN|nr:hypothetical protein P43SY_011437 [Pythium insidiosum]
MHPCSYFWVRVPTVSGVQWHPFSAIVMPSGDSFGFCIRAGSSASSFTRQLYEVGVSTHSLAVNLCGPYGRISVDVDDYDVVLLVAGGVGVTPLLSAVNQRRLMGGGSRGSKSTEWHVLWSVRSREDLLMADPLMATQAASHPQQQRGATSVQEPYQELSDSGAGSLSVSWTMHCSAEKEGGVVTRGNGEELHYRGGMAVLEEHINSSRFMGRRVAVLACGPPTMVVEAQSLARQSGFDFHKEVFNW